MYTPAPTFDTKIGQELRQAGVSRYGMLKFNAHYLHRIIHPDEHIKAVVYGHYGTELIGTEGMLVATDRRVVFLDHKPGYTNMEEFSYDVISGVRFAQAGVFTSVTLHTKLGSFTIKYANANCARRFVSCIGTRRVELSNLDNEHPGPLARQFH